MSQRHGSADPDPHQNVIGSATLFVRIIFYVYIPTPGDKVDEHTAEHSREEGVARRRQVLAPVRPSQHVRAMDYGEGDY